MTDLLPDLIDKNDNFEIIRDQIALILANEQQNQQDLAIAAAKDPALWELRIFTERSSTWEQELNKVDQEKTGAPIVNVWYQTDSIDSGSGNSVSARKYRATFNIDVYGFGQSSDNPSGGHNPGDQDAAFEAQRGARLVRNILMAGLNRYLQLPKQDGSNVVQRRDFRDRTALEPQLNTEAIQWVVAIRMAFEVHFLEFSPQVDGPPLEFISVDIKRDSDGMVLAEADYDFAA